MSEGYPNGPHLYKKTIVLTEKNIHGCSENSVSEEALVAALHGRYIFSLNISAKPTFLITKRLPSYNCCEITITNFNSFVLSCT